LLEDIQELQKPSNKARAKLRPSCSAFLNRHFRLSLSKHSPIPHLSLGRDGKDFMKQK